MDFYVFDPCDSAEESIDLTSYPFKDVEALTKQCGFNPTYGNIYTPVSLNGHADGETIEARIMRGT